VINININLDKIEEISTIKLVNTLKSLADKNTTFTDNLIYESVEDYLKNYKSNGK
jgi:hypothetical protein